MPPEMEHAGRRSHVSILAAIKSQHATCSIYQHTHRPLRTSPGRSSKRTGFMNPLQARKIHPSCVAKWCVDRPHNRGVILVEVGAVLTLEWDQCTMIHQYSRARSNKGVRTHKSSLTTRAVQAVASVVLTFCVVIGCHANSSEHGVEGGNGNGG